VQNNTTLAYCNRTIDLSVVKLLNSFNMNKPFKGRTKDLPRGLNVLKTIWYYDTKGNPIYFPNRRQRHTKTLNGKNGSVQHVPIFKDGEIISFKTIFHQKFKMKDNKAIINKHAKKYHYEHL